MFVAKFERFEDIDAWKKGRELAKAVYSASNSNSFSRDYGLRDQIRRAAVSVMSNISEGFERSSNKDFVRFLYIAKASSGEVRSQLYVALDQNYIDQNSFDIIYQIALDVSKMISGLISYLSQHF
jgi:four helix bundle protein